ncbi:contractile injection system tape measure protein [Rhodanobacter sp. AS-Z3]|uniref:contractile injection system tape measure protein n=1 Tax=Rhodanobacter sp. AS-Z3 TaxID=3031330 RepID=UPI00247892A9|nr:contractile injection system tape measure protein [Rhodanobacter sp. AS-Z3]WEN13759.1 contractile injection system tape measure protein [Rhodanobacter sp. AS-Z3]
MSQAWRHVIRREYIDLDVEGGELDGFALQAQLAALCHGELTVALDEAFSRAVPGEEHWQFDRIDVDAGHFTQETFAGDFVAAVAAAVKVQIKERQAQAIAQPEVSAEEGDVQWSGAQSIDQAFLYFLATGVLPWWCRLPEGQTLESMLDKAWSEVPGQGQGGSTEALALVALMRVLSSAVPRLRMVRQFSQPFLGRVLERLAPTALVVLREVVAAVHHEWALALPAAVPEQAWVATFVCAVTQQTISQRHLLEAWATLTPEFITPAIIASVLRAATTHAVDLSLKQLRDKTSVSESKPATSTAAPSRRDAQDATSPQPADGSRSEHRMAISAKPLDLHEDVFIDCAGMVLLHPFLPRLFERLELIADDHLLQPDRALALLHFLATGQSSAPEHALVLPKLLCGMEAFEIAGAPVELGEADRTEAENLLQSAIDYWPAIGQTTLDGFRGNFLVRPGKLGKRGDEDLLQIEKQSWDILLGQLPWSIGVVRLPWMRRMLWVEWPY